MTEQPRWQTGLADARSWRRSRSDRYVAGVCGGLARTFGVDPTVFRILAGLVLLSIGVGPLLYLAAWVLIPEDDAPAETPDSGSAGTRPTDRRPRRLLLVLLLVACVVAVDTMMRSGPRFFLPFLVVAVVVAYVFWRKRHGCDAGAGGRGGYVAGGYDRTRHRTADAPGSADTARSAADTAAATAATPAGSTTTTRPGVDWASEDPLGLYHGDEYSSNPEPAPPTTVEPRRRRPVKTGIALITAGAMTAAWFGLGLTPTWVFVVGLATLGIGMVIGSFFGRTAALFPIGVLLAVGMVLAAPLDRMHYGDQTWAPVAIDQRAHFEGGVGEADLDLTATDLPDGATITVDHWAGTLTVRVPTTVAIDGQACTKLGEVDNQGTVASGVNTCVPLAHDLDGDPAAAQPPVRLTLHLNNRVGEIKVIRQ